MTSWSARTVSAPRSALSSSGEEPRYAGFNARQGVVDTDIAKEGHWQTILGRGQHFKTYPVGRWSMYWTAACNEAAGQKELGADLKRTVLERFEGWPEPVEELVGPRTSRGPSSRTPTTASRWTAGGRAGSRCSATPPYPMTWNRGQGASQGVEGAVLPAKRLAAGGDDPVGALRAWEAERIPRTTKLVKGPRQRQDRAGSGGGHLQAPQRGPAHDPGPDLQKGEQEPAGRLRERPMTGGPPGGPPGPPRSMSTSSAPRTSPRSSGSTAAA